MTRTRLGLTRPQILAFRRHTGELDEGLPSGPRSLRRAAWAGLQDSMPRAALLSIHARVAGAKPSTWEDRRRGNEILGAPAGGSAYHDRRCSLCITGRNVLPRHCCGQPYRAARPAAMPEGAQ